MPALSHMTYLTSYYEFHIHFVHMKTRVISFLQNRAIEISLFTHYLYMLSHGQQQDIIFLLLFYSLGQWLSTELMSCMNDLIQIGFKIRGLVTDNHSTNVAAFKYC